MRRVLGLIVAALVLAAGCSAGRSAAGAAADEAQVSVSACGHGWTGGRAGRVHLVLHNVDTRAGEVALVDPADGGIYLDVEPLAPGTSTTVSADLGAGRYVLRCAMEDEPAVTGPVVTLTGSAHGDTPVVRPVDQGDLLTATRAYERYVTGQLPALRSDVTRLRTDVVAGNRLAARRDWLTAQLAYLRLGAAYSAFGGLDAAIKDGLHKAEYGLWHSEALRTLRPTAADLVLAVARLQRDFPHAQLDPAQLAIRAHEITEDAIEFALGGRDDFGAHAGRAEVQADLAATRTVLGLVRPLLAPRYPALAQLDRWLERTAGDLSTASVSHERVDSDVGELAELLAPVASVLEPRRTS